MSTITGMTGMRRKTIGLVTDGEDQEQFDYDSLIHPGVTMLKFGKSGDPHERLFKLSGDRRFLSWRAGWFSSKLGKLCQVDLEKVSKILQGQNTYQFQRWADPYNVASEKSFSIIYQDEDNQEQTLDLIAPSADVYDLWFNGIQALVQKLADDRKNYSLDMLYLKTLWDRADADHSGTLTQSEVFSMLSLINVNMPRDRMKAMFRKFDVDNSGALDFKEFMDFMAQLRRRPEMEALFSLCVTGVSIPKANASFLIDTENSVITDATVTLEQFVAFWHKLQGEDLAEEEAKELVEFCNATHIGDAADNHADGHRTSKDKKQAQKEAAAAAAAKAAILAAAGGSNAEYLITYSMFSNVFNNHKKSSLFEPEKLTVYQDMTLPLSYYYMASSHNTYLEGDQLTSFSSIKRYVSDLSQGCRCVELDCWDGENNIPMICHGHTITGKIVFKDVIKAIYEYGFVTSQYPIVLSIENHCSHEQQKILAKIMVDVLKETLALPMQDVGSDTMLPSPEQLKRKVLIKGKRLPDADRLRLLQEAGADEDDDSDDEDDEDEEDDDMLTAQGGMGSIAANNSVKMSKEEARRKAKEAKKKKKTKVKVHPDLSAITYLGTGHVKKFNLETRTKIPCDMMCSYSEPKTEKYMKHADIVQGWIEHNKKHLSRIYPKGTRVDSSNYSPVTPWAAGAQLVALNYQTGDFPMHQNHGRFLENGRSGYVLKPDYMIDGTAPRLRPIRITVNVISGHHFPKPGGAQKGEIIDPFVVVALSGPTPADCHEARTRTIDDNGYNPVWNQTFVFDCHQPDASHMTFTVNDEDVLSSDFICFGSIPVTCMRKGVRIMQMYSVDGRCDFDYEYAALCIRVDMEPLEEDKPLSSASALDASS